MLAAAIKAGAQVIVTDNLRDFPPDCLDEWNLEAKSIDEFILDLISLSREVVYACVQQIADGRTRPPGTVEDVLRQLERSGLIESAAALSLG